jgi:hypothetical protein
MKTKREVLNSIEKLYDDIDGCITNIVRSRLTKDTELEGRSLFHMEGLIVASQQELSFLHQYINDNIIEEKDNDQTGSDQ